MKNRIREIRKCQGMTQLDFAQATGKTRDSIASYELGRVTPDAAYIQLLAVKFGYSEEWIRTGSGSPQPDKSIGDQLGEIAAAASMNNVEAVREYFRDLGDRFTDAEILFLYEIFQRHFGKQE